VADGAITHLAQQICWVWQELPVPVVAAIHGHALGGGLQLALGADIRIAHPDTKLSVRELHWGITPDMTGTFMLSRLVRNDIARELTYTARVFDAREGAELGLVTRLSEQPYDEAMALAREIAGRNPNGVRGAKRLFNRMFTEGAAEQFADERRVIASLIGTPNQVEAITANIENRPAQFDDGAASDAGL
jgi:enoyl-CoA hydratase/carnithine racemase